MGRSIAITFCAGLFATPAFAQMTCAALGSYLASQPNISQFVPPPPAAQVPVPFTALVPATSTPPNAARCEDAESCKHDGDRGHGHDDDHDGHHHDRD